MRSADCHRRSPPRNGSDKERTSEDRWLQAVSRSAPFQPLPIPVTALFGRADCLLPRCPRLRGAPSRRPVHRRYPLHRGCIADGHGGADGHTGMGRAARLSHAPVACTGRRKPVTAGVTPPVGARRRYERPGVRPVALLLPPVFESVRFPRHDVRATTSAAACVFGAL